jgi:hypothetical protein
VTTPPQRPPLRLSPGELAFALLVQGQEQAAIDLVQQQLGLARVEEARLVIGASGQALLARGLAEVEPPSSCKLTPPLERAVGLTAGADMMISCRRSGDGREVAITFHRAGDGLVGHRMSDDGIHELIVLADLADAADMAVDFFATPTSVIPGLPSFSMRQSLVEELNDRRERTFIAEQLAHAGVPGIARAALADDLLGPGSRGSIVRVDRWDAEAWVAENRLFLLEGAARLWLMQPYPSAADWFLRFSLGSKDELRDAILRIGLESPPPRGKDRVEGA